MKLYYVDGKKIFLLRLNNGYTKSKFSKQYNISLEHIKKIEENGPITYRILLKLADIFLIDKNSLLLNKIDNI